MFLSLKEKLYLHADNLIIGLLVRIRAKLIRKPPAVGECPGLESLAAFVDHKLRFPEKHALEEHLADCWKCRKIVVMVYKSQKNSPDPLPPKPEGL